jgi:hypothetical protein
MPNTDYAKIAAALVGGTPLDFKAYPDGSLVVIAPSGQKYRFTPQEVLSVLPKPAPKPTSPGRLKSTSKATSGGKNPNV